MDEGRAGFCIGVDHPSIAGHFPGNPIVPGVVLVDCVLAAVRAVRPDARLIGIPNLKFMQPLRPGTPFTVCWSAQGAQVRFRCESGTTDAPVQHVQGLLSFAGDAG